MPKQLFEISDFKNWIVNDETTQSNKWFVDMLWLDPWSEEWILQINNRLEAETTTSMTSSPLSNVVFDWKIISWNSDKELWYESTANTWTLMHTNTNNWDNNDIIVYQDYLIYASNDRLWRSTWTTIWAWFTDSPTRWSGTTFSNGTSADDHFFKIFNNRLYVSDWNFIAELDWASDPATPWNWIFTAEKFILPKWESINSLEVTWWLLAIWTESGTFYLWDWSSANASQIIKTTLWSISAMIQLENTLFVFAWIWWTVYRYNWADLIPVIQIPNFNMNADTFVRKPAVRRYKNGIIFWIPDNWIYVFNRIKEWDSFSLVKYWNLNWWKTIDNDDGIIYSIFMTSTWSTNAEFIVWYDHSSTKGIDRTWSVRYRMYEAWSWDTSAAPYLETFVYELRDNNWKPTKVQWVQWLFKETVESSTDRNNIEVEYRINRDTSYTVLWDIWNDWIDLDKILRWIGKRVDKIQFKVKFWEKSTSDVWNRNTKLTNLKIF